MGKTEKEQGEAKAQQTAEEVWREAEARMAEEAARKAAEEQAAREQAEAQRRADELAARVRAEEEARLAAEEDARRRGEQPRRVEILVNNFGPTLLQEGAITSDPKAVAWLDRPGGWKLVREVK
jgi:NAD(P)-dependent dehydrogenase (short-subunit alcohol dehydrogenase family)